MGLEAGCKGADSDHISLKCDIHVLQNNKKIYFNKCLLEGSLKNLKSIYFFNHKTLFIFGKLKDVA